MSLRMRVVALILLASFALFAKSPQTKITVLIVDQANKPLPGASVVLDFLGSRQMTKFGRHKRINWEMHTDLKGLAHFPSVPQGTVLIQVIDPHHATFGKRFKVEEAEKTITIKLKPPQNQYTANPGPK
ncbi:MAG: hypothetical protein ACRD45_18040, partial [Bryobacteraceae bacterium]